MEETTSNRWRAYGHDRLYVKLAATNARIGWIDLKTGVATLESAIHDGELLTAAAAWRTSSSTGWSIDPAATPKRSGPLSAAWAPPTGTPASLPPPVKAVVIRPHSRTLTAPFLLPHRAAALA